jgi:transporter family-2 protein
MNKILWVLIAFVAGSFLPIQAGLNNKMGKSLGNPVYASMISFIIGAISVGAYVLLTKQSVSLSGIKTAPFYVWFAGLLGAFYVTAIILDFRQIGPALTFGLVVAGQMVISVLLAHFQVLGAQPHPINIWRVLGVLLIVAGVAIIQKF